jgi:hypothetical protein
MKNLGRLQRPMKITLIDAQPLTASHRMKCIRSSLLVLSRPEHDQLIVVPFVITCNIPSPQNRSSDFIGRLNLFPALPQLAPILEDAAELEHRSRHLVAKIFALFKNSDRLVKQLSMENVVSTRCLAAQPVKAGSTSK